MIEIPLIIQYLILAVAAAVFRIAGQYRRDKKLGKKKKMTRTEFLSEVVIAGGAGYLAYEYVTRTGVPNHLMAAFAGFIAPDISELLLGIEGSKAKQLLIAKLKGLP